MATGRRKGVLVTLSLYYLTLTIIITSKSYNYLHNKKEETGAIREYKELGVFQRLELGWMKLVCMRAVWKGTWSGLSHPLLPI